MSKKMISITALFLCFIMIALSCPLSVSATDNNSYPDIWDGSISTSFTRGDNGEYLITSGADLALLMQKLDRGDIRDSNFVLTNDIILNNYSDWQEWSKQNPPNNILVTPTNGFSYYYGYFNGNNHTIYGLYSETGALFDSVYGAHLYNIRIECSKVYGKAALVEYARYADIMNCYNGANVENETGEAAGIATTLDGSSIENSINAGTIVGIDGVGGIACTCGSSSIKNCINYGSVSGNKSIGGIASSLSSYETQGKITNCINAGNINGNERVGGITGGFGASRSYSYIKSCQNYGEISGVKSVGGISGYGYDMSSLYTASYVESSSNHGIINGNLSIGGIIGIIDGERSIRVENCYNTAKIMGEKYAGGILGNSEITVRFPGSKIVKKSFNIGEVHSNDSYGGLVGSNNDDIYCYNSYYLDSIAGNIEKGVPLTIYQFDHQSSFTEYDFENTWQMNHEKGYPELRLSDMPSYYPYNNSLTDTDLHIIEQVKKYTSEGFSENSPYTYIMNSQASDEVKMKVLNEYFVNNGFTDAKEGIDYLRDTSTYRDDYRFLTTDEIFCATNYYDWLYSDSGFAARAALYSSGMIFNGELTAYFNPTTYTDRDYPGVKKNKKFLKDFLEQNEHSFEDLKGAKTSAKYLSNLLKLNNIETSDSIEELMDHVMSATSQTDRENYQKQFANYIIREAQANGNSTIYIEGERFSKALKYSSGVIEFINATANDIYELMYLDQEIAKYEYYKDFLTDIYNCEYVSSDMRMAAYLLLDDINNGYYNRIVGMLGNVLKMGQSFVTVDYNIWKDLFGASGELFGEALGTIKLGVFISNIVVDTGDFVNQVSYTLGYGELSKVYCAKLKQDKTAFLTAQTAENAWQFFSDYTMLWSLRYKGEDQYLKMNRVKMFIFGEVKTSDYTMKYDVANDNQRLLNQKKFEFAANYTIPEGVMYSSKAVINCPVDVYVYNQAGDLIAELIDGVESDVTNEYGRFAVMKQSYSGEYAKVIALNNPDSVVIKSVAHSQGLVDYSIAAVKNNEVTSYSLNNISVTDGSVITTSNNSSTYSLDYTGDETNVVEGQMIEVGDEYVAVETIVSDISNVDLQVGEKQLLSVSITPDNATNQTVDWYTDKEDIVSIKNGVVEALKPGVATVYVKAIDTDDVILPFVVNVIPQATITGHSLSLNGDIGINFYVDVPDEDVNDNRVKVDFTWSVDGTENTHSVTLSADNKYNLGYKASCPVAVAEMTYDVTATVTIDGVIQSVPDTYSAQKYAKAILHNENNFMNKYITAENEKGRNGEQRYNDLITLVQSMLDYGTKAQITFDRDVEHPANEGTDFFGDASFPVSAEIISVTEENMDMDLSVFGLRYKGSTVVYLSETSIRHYYYVDDWDSFNEIKDNITFDGVSVGYTEKDGAIYFEKKGVSASNLDTPYTLTIKDKSCKFAVNDYIRHCLESTKVSDNTKALVKATYRYNVAANAFFEV